MSDWYRKALGIPGTALECPQRQITLTVFEPCWPSLLADLKAGCQHPEPGTRVATQIAIWGLWFAVAGLLPVLLDHDPAKHWLECHDWLFLCVWLPVCLILGCICLFLSGGVKSRFRR